MPITFDQYSACGYKCLYCFAYYQKSLGRMKETYLRNEVRCVDVEKVKRLFTDGAKNESEQQYAGYIAERLAIQWGGMADPFDENERRYGVGLELLRFFREIEYPISFSTKGTWWIDDPRYRELFEGANFWHVKVSIITLDREKARKIEVQVPPPEDRLALIGKLSQLGLAGVTLRLRPFIIGVSSPSHLELIERAAQVGADSVSTEFMCLEVRSARARTRYLEMSRLAGYNLYKMYRAASPGQSGYLRLTRSIKEPYIRQMQEKCASLGIRFHVSDAHFKECGANGSCCGCPSTWPYSRGQFTEALMIAKEKGRVTWSDIEPYTRKYTFPWHRSNMNTKDQESRARFRYFSIADWMRWNWNNVNSPKSPYVYFGGILKPVGKDDKGDVIYEYADIHSLQESP